MHPVRLLCPLLLSCLTFALSPPDCTATGLEDLIAAPEAGYRTRLIQPRLGRALSLSSAEKREDIAQAFLIRELAPEGQLAHLNTVEGGGGVTFVSFEQRFEGVPVALSRSTVAIRANGEVFAAMIGDLAKAGPAPSRPGRRLSSAHEARRASGQGHAPVLDPLGRDVMPLAEQVLVPTSNLARRAWRVRVVPDEDEGEIHDVFLAEDDASLLHRVPTSFPGIESGRMFPGDPTNASQLVTLPDPVTNPSYFSPLGWCTDEETIGNNVTAILHREGGVTSNGPASQGVGMPVSLDFPYTGDPVVDTDAAVANAFLVLNDAHDHFHRLGFNEASGAMQEDNYGRGGRDEDSVLALVQHNSIDGTQASNNIRMGLSPDGNFTWIQIGLFSNDDGTEIRDGAFEQDMLLHEYAHSVSTRMVGNDTACLTGVQPRALSEGWSDFLAASMTDDPVIGGWTAFEPIAGQREFALDENPLSLVQFCSGGCNTFRDSGIWSGMLWDLRSILQAELGPEEGRLTAERLVVEGMRYTPCRPTLQDARDGILLADVAVYGGANRCSIWSAALGRGMGYSMNTVSPDDEVPDFAFDSAPECSTGLALAFDAEEYGTAGAVGLELVDAGAPDGTTVSVTSTSGDAESVAMSMLSGGALLTSSLPLAPGPAVPGDGILQVEDGDTLQAVYDMDPSVTASSFVNLSLDLALTSHYVGGSGCQADFDDDHEGLAGWQNLPGFVDAGETAGMLISGLSRSEQALVDATVQVTSLNPKLRILPSGPQSIGTIAAASSGNSTPFSFILFASASPTVVAGETAELEVRVESQGRSAVLSYTIEMNLDYELSTAVSPFQGGVETFEVDSPTQGLWTHQANIPGGDNWGVYDCAGIGGTGGAGNMDSTCFTYDDDQGNPTLISPPVFVFPPNAVSWRLQDVSWQHKMQLYTSATIQNCNADMIGVFLTDDPTILPYEDPIGAIFLASGNPLALYVHTSNGFDFTEQIGSAGTLDVPVDPAVDYGAFRLYWLFFSDILNEDNSALCTEEFNSGTYNLDDVRVVYDVVSTVPEATPCAADCGVLANLRKDPDIDLCAGEAFTLDASRSEGAACENGLIYSFSGPGVPPEYASTLESSAPAVAEDDGQWTVVVSCIDEPECASAATRRNPPPQVPGVGFVLGDSLRVWRDGDDIHASWRGMANPASYGLFSVTDAAEVGSPPSSWGLAAGAMGEGPNGEGKVVLDGAALAAGFEAYRAFPRDPCTNLPILP